MERKVVVVKVSRSGRMTIPAAQRALLGVEGGRTVVLRMEDGELRIRSIEDVIERLQALVREGAGQTEGSAVEWLLRERRREVAMEEAEHKAWENAANERGPRS